MMNHLLRFIIGNTTIRLSVLIALDTVTILASVWIAFLLRFEGYIPDEHLLNATGFSLLAVAISIPIFWYFKLYSFSFSYISTDELVAIARANGIAFLGVGLVLFLVRDTVIFNGFPRSVLFLSAILIFLGTSMARFAKRILASMLQGGDSGAKERTIIVGAGDAGVQLLRSIRASQDSPYFPIGFIDDDPVKRGRIIHGLRVLGTVADIPTCVQNFSVSQMIVALPSAGSTIIKQTVECGRQAGLKKIKIVPSVAELIEDEVTLRNLQEVHIEDLLGRDPVVPDEKKIRELVEGKVVLVTGAAGSIGSELSRQIARFNPKKLLILDNDETRTFDIKNELSRRYPSLPIKELLINIRDAEKIGLVFRVEKPNLVFHAAAFKHLSLMETHADEAVKNNIFGTRIVLETAIKYSVEKVIFISTDKAVRPTSIMGMTKRVCESMCQSLDKTKYTRCIAVRFGNVLNSRGSVIPTFKEQIKRGGPVQVTHPDMERYFMLIDEACLLVLQAGAIGAGGEIFVLDMGRPVKILDLAKELIRLSGYEPDKDIPIVFTDPRPGEKLTEELVTQTEKVAQTEYQKIVKICDAVQPDAATLFELIDSLDQYFTDYEKLKEVLRSLTA
ncbi:polysaccharide biosynthesis protein [Candidatus Uhrbacteria bacterium]|nr:polysaccharide biosynthesis protein [Candidatus Uhrbacteria bacterium]